MVSRNYLNGANKKTNRYGVNAFPPHNDERAAIRDEFITETFLGCPYQFIGAYHMNVVSQYRYETVPALC